MKKKYKNIQTIFTILHEFLKILRNFDDNIEKNFLIIKNISINSLNICK
jgi:hypothetical protein